MAISPRPWISRLNLYTQTATYTFFLREYNHYRAFNINLSYVTVVNRKYLKKLFYI